MPGRLILNRPMVGDLRRVGVPVVQNGETCQQPRHDGLTEVLDIPSTRQYLAYPYNRVSLDASIEYIRLLRGIEKKQEVRGFEW